MEDLTRDVHRAQPRDLLQYCANWFQSRLEAQRIRFRDTADRSPNNAAQRRDLYDEWAPAGLPPGPKASTPSPRPSLDAAPFLKNPFGAQSALNTFAPAPDPFGTGHGGGAPFLTINEEEVLSPSAFTTPFADPFAPKLSAGDTSGNTLALPPGLLGRRTSVSAESIVPGSRSNEAVPFHPKTPEQLKIEVLWGYITIDLSGRFRGKYRVLSAAIRARTLVSNTASFTSKVFISRWFHDSLVSPGSQFPKHKLSTCRWTSTPSARLRNAAE